MPPTLMDKIGHNCFEEISRELGHYAEIQYSRSDAKTAVTIGKGYATTITIRPFGTSARYTILFYDGKAVATSGIKPIITYYYEDPHFPTQLYTNIKAWMRQELPWIPGLQHAYSNASNETTQTANSP